MKVSIITPTSNSGRFLACCIRSVQSQTYHDIEHIIIDNKSTDNTLRIIRENESGISCWISESDRGVYDAINKGLKIASGDIVGVLNSDDEFADNTVVSQIVDRFTDAGVEAVYGDLQYVNENDTSQVYRYWKSIAYKRSRFYWGWMPAHPTFYIRLSLIKKYGGYQQCYFSAADYEFMCRYLFKYRVKALYIPQLLIKMRRGGQSNGSLKQRLRANRRDYLAMKINGIPFPLFSSVLKPLSKINQYNLRDLFMRKNHGLFPAYRNK